MTAHRGAMGRATAGRGAVGRGAPFLLVGASLGLGGCFGGWIPGEGADRAYKGPSDPAVADLSAEAEAALSERFERVQAR